jgi:GNAT superfamily N-acetyltransferase
VFIIEERRDAYLISTDPARLDARAIHAYLEQSYWASGIPLDVVERAIRGSLCIGLYDDGRQVGFARAVTDRATFAYLADVYVLESHRGRGLAAWMVGTLLAHPDLQGLRRLSLVTKDAHGLYARFGFTPLQSPDMHMELTRPDVYRRSTVER